MSIWLTLRLVLGMMRTLTDPIEHLVAEEVGKDAVMNVHLKMFNYHFQLRAEPVELVKGVCSTVEGKGHVLMWDFDYATFTEAVESLIEVQSKYQLPAIYLGSSGRVNGWHAYCLKVQSFADTARVLLDTDKADKAATNLGIARGYWVLRFTDKKNAIIGDFMKLPGFCPDDCSFTDLKRFVIYWTRRK